MGIAVNVFNKGIQSDIDNLYLSGETYDLLENGELELNSDNVFVIKSIRGTKQVIELKDGATILRPIAWKQLENKLFVLSQASDVSYLGYIDLLSTPYQYTLLNNVKLSAGAEITPFKVNWLGYDENSRVQMHLKKIYDGSINIYLNDGVNYSYVINTRTCFNGNENDCVYYPNSFSSGKGMHIMGSHIPKTDSISVYDGGNMKPGVYVFFVRYLDSFGNKTKFFYNTKPVTIAPGISSSSRYSFPNTKEDTARTSKKVELQLIGLNTDYSHYEVGYIRQYTVGEADLVEAKIIDGKYELSSSTSIVITGNERLISTTVEEIYKLNPVTPIWKSALFKNGRMFMGGLKSGSKVDDTKAKEFFKRIVPKFSLGTVSPFGINPIDDVGYFDEEIYQFVGYFIYNDLTVSPLFPVAGYYTYGTFNDTGYVKVPLLHLHNMDIQKNISVSFDISTTVDGDTAQNYFLNNFTLEERSRIVGFNILRSERVPNLLYSGIVSPTTFRFTNSPYIDFEESYGSVLTFNGIVVGYKSATVNKAATAGTTSKYLATWSTSQSYKTAYHYPFYKGVAPGYFVPKTFCLINYVSYRAANAGEKMRLAFFSPDVMLTKNHKISNGENVYVSFVSRFNEAQINGSLDNDNPSFFGNVLSRSTEVLANFAATAYVVPEETVMGPGNFSSYIKDYFNAGKKSDELFFHARIDVPSREKDWTSALRSNRTARYIGLELTQTDIVSYDASYGTYYYYAKIYKNLNDSTFYNNVIKGEKKNKNYYLIDSPYTLDDLLFYPSNINNRQVYGGDCFTKWFQFLFNKSAEFGGTYITGEPEEWYGDNGYGKVDSDGINNCHVTSQKKYHFGLLMALRTYSELNPAARISQDNSTFFEAEKGAIEPNASSNSYINAVKTYVQSGSEKYYKESHLGYTALSKQALLYRIETLGKESYDEQRYISTVMYSDREVPTEFVDSYRNVDFTKAKTFATKYGGIVAMLNRDDYIFIVHKNGLTLHTSEMQMQQVNENQAVSIGVGEVLPSQMKELGNYGAACFDNVAMGRRGIYGYDESVNILWYLDFESMTQYDLPKARSSYGFIKKYITDYGKQSSLSSIVKNYPIVYFDDIGSNIIFSSGKYGATIFFNEDLKAYTNSMTESIRLIFGFGNTLYMSNASDSGIKGKIFSFDGFGISERLYIFEKRKTFVLSIRTNGGKDEAGNLISKLFDSVLIASKYTVFDRIKFSSDYMVGDYDTFFDLNRAEFWQNPSWKENHWAVPVLVKTDQKYGYAPIPVTNNNQYIFGIDPETGIRGLWMGVELQFDGSDLKEDNEVVIKSMMFNYKKSEL